MRDITTPVSARTNGLRPAALAALVGLLLVLSAGAPTRDGESDSAAGRVHSSAELAEAEAWFRAHATKLTEREIADASEAVAEGARAKNAGREGEVFDLAQAAAGEVEHGSGIRDV